MSNVFKITYFNGAIDHIKLELEEIEHVAGQIFGKTVAELKEFGGNVEFIGEYIPDAIVAEVTESAPPAPPAPASAPVQSSPPNTPPVLTAADGTTVENPFASPPTNSETSEGTSEASATVTTPPLPIAESSEAATTQTADVAPPVSGADVSSQPAA